MYTMKIAIGFVLLLSGSVQALDAGEWTICITNDNCPDYTWGLTEEQTRQAFADLVRAHLDEMNRTDNLEPANRDRYNMAVTQEALCFVERYPERQAELIRRIKEGRVFVSPFLCNSLWAFHSTECALRVLYPARRLERDWGIPMDVAEHIEEPSLPWGMASILAGAGVRWLSVPFYNYDSTFKQLKNPPLFLWEGPDGSRLRVIMDPWASNKASYAQGAAILKKPESIEKEWLPHYGGLGEVYPLRAILASGTHSDIAPRSGDQARGFANAIIKYNAGDGPHLKLINATVPQFCEVADRLQAERPFLPTVRGCFGHSWDLWPVSLAKSVADMRQGERTYLAAETLLSIAAHNRPEVRDATRGDRERAEWCWAMLSDHAWNGTDMKNKRHNAELRRKWNGELARLGAKLMEQGWAAAGRTRDSQTITVFNSLSFPRIGLVHMAVPEEVRGEGVPPLRLEAILASSSEGGTPSTRQPIPGQIVREGQEHILYFVAPEVPAFSFRQFQIRPNDDSPLPSQQDGAGTSGLSASATGLESPFYRLSIDVGTCGVASLVHKASGRDLCAPGSHGLCQTVFFDGKEHTPENVKTELVAEGPVLARIKVTGTVAGIEVTSFITVYAELDQVDFDLYIHKPVTTKEQRLCHVFPVVQEGAELRIETPGAVIRPRPQPQGDLLPGADARRFAVQGFVDASMPDGAGVTIVPLDAFALRLDLDPAGTNNHSPLRFEALGNDQNYREVTQDQDGVTDFRFRYVLRGHTRGYRNAETVAWSRSAATPLLSVPGSVRRGAPPWSPRAATGARAGTGACPYVDPSRAIATCLKPADGDGSAGFILRLWETAGKSDPIRIGLTGYSKAVQTDLLERDVGATPRGRPGQAQGPAPTITDGHIEAKVNPNGLSSIRLVP